MSAPHSVRSGRGLSSAGGICRGIGNLELPYGDAGFDGDSRWEILDALGLSGGGKDPVEARINNKLVMDDAIPSGYQVVSSRRKVSLSG